MCLIVLLHVSSLGGMLQNRSLSMMNFAQQPLPFVFCCPRLRLCGPSREALKGLENGSVAKHWGLETISRKNILRLEPFFFVGEAGKSHKIKYNHSIVKLNVIKRQLNFFFESQMNIKCVHKINQ